MSKIIIMDRLKSIFVSVFITYVIIIAIYAVYQLVLGTDSISWCVNLVVAGTVIVYFAKIFLIQTPRTTQHMSSLTVAVALGFIGVIYAYSDRGNSVALIVGFIGFIGWLLYTYWATDFSGRNITAVKVGNKMPDVELKNPDGEVVALSRYFNAPAVILFYRGNWCPFCMAQIRELSAEYRRIKEKGAALVFISPQSPGHTRNLAKKFDIPATFLIDEDLGAARKLDIFNAFGTPLGMEVLGYSTDNVFPTLIITDRDGVVRFADLTDNYRMRPEPGDYLRVLDKMD